MKNSFCISDIAWEENSPEIFSLLHRYGIDSLELAPGKLWKNFESVKDQDIQEKRHFYTEEGFAIVAFQAILFGHPEFQVFHKASHPSFLRHLEHIARIASGLGAKILVYGAPRSRRRGELPWAEAWKQAGDFFRQAGEIVWKYGCVLGLEANPADYQCDFLTNTADLKEFVESVDVPGIRLHFDTGATMLNGASPLEILQTAGMPVHYHVSAPRLENPADHPADHQSAFRYLKEIGYQGAVSIEMKKAEPVIGNLEKALKYVKEALDAARI